MKLLAFMVRLLFILLFFLACVELVWRTMTPGQRNHLLHLLPTLVIEKITIDPVQPSLIQYLGFSIYIPERAVNSEFHGIPSEMQIAIEWPGKNTPITHANGGACISPDSIRPPKPLPKTSGVYKWVDEQGKVHFGDKPTATSEDLSKQYRVNNSGMTLVMQYPNWVGSRTIEADLKKEADLMYRIFSQLVPVKHRRPVTLNITLFENQAAYARFRADQGIPPTTGAFYRANEHRIYMPMFNSAPVTRAVARHEMTHAMTVAILGSLPVWLMEGIAEYMERLQWQMSAATVAVDAHALMSFNGGARLDIEELTSMSYRRFYSSDLHLNYAGASLLVHFLMGHTEGRAWLKQVLADFAVHPCRHFGARQEFEAYYPGGIDAFSKRFQNWLTAREHLPHRY